MIMIMIAVMDGMVMIVIVIMVVMVMLMLMMTRARFSRLDERAGQDRRFSRGRWAPAGAWACVHLYDQDRRMPRRWRQC